LAKARNPAAHSCGNRGYAAARLSAEHALTVVMQRIAV
jgi:hypothetical protein